MMTQFTHLCVTTDVWGQNELTTYLLNKTPQKRHTSRRQQYLYGFIYINIEPGTT